MSISNNNNKKRTLKLSKKIDINLKVSQLVVGSRNKSRVVQVVHKSKASNSLDGLNIDGNLTKIERQKREHAVKSVEKIEGPKALPNKAQLTAGEDARIEELKEYYKSVKDKESFPAKPIAPEVKMYQKSEVKNKFSQDSKKEKENNQHGRKNKGRFNKTDKNVKIDNMDVGSGFAETERSRIKEFLGKRQKIRKSHGSRNFKQRISRSFIIPDVVSVVDLAKYMSVKVKEVNYAMGKIDKKLLNNKTINANTAQKIAKTFGCKARTQSTMTIESLVEDLMSQDNEQNVSLRPPVVTVMGHVDHGKTSLLDAIRNSSVAKKEEGGITQAIGAYQVNVNKKINGIITFIDTPGHEAFTSLRSRGANITDIVVLVVAADDGVMPQTAEAISHAKKANVPIIVAVNKIDKQGVNVDKTINDLMRYGISPESLGGEHLFVNVSALKGTNLDMLNELILLQAEMEDIKANFNRKANGVILATRIVPGLGTCISLIVKGGILKAGDVVATKTSYGCVKIIRDYNGNNIASASPGMPVEIVGLSGEINDGDIFVVVDSDKIAYRVLENHKTTEEINVIPEDTMEDLFGKNNKPKELCLLIKADACGSLEAIQYSIEKLDTKDIKIKILRSDVGNILESDVLFANISNAIILAFNVGYDNRVNSLIKQKNVEVVNKNVIYDIIDDIEGLIKRMLGPSIKMIYTGSAAVVKVFDTGHGKVAGCHVKDGIITRGSNAKLIRNENVVYEGKIKSMRHYKEDIVEARANFECGIIFDNFSDIKGGDVIRVFKIEKINQTSSV